MKRFTVDDYNRILLALTERKLHYDTVFFTVPGMNENKALRAERDAYESVYQKVTLRRKKLLEREAQK